MASTQERVLGSARYLSDNLARIPALLIPCIPGRIDAQGLPPGAAVSILGSIIPATWSFMLAARERGIGSCWTTLHLNFEHEVGELLGIPADYSQIALIPLAYTLGTDFKPAPRKPLDQFLHIDSW